MKKLLLTAALAVSTTAHAVEDSHLPFAAQRWMTFDGEDYGVRGVNVDTDDHFASKWMATTYAREDGVSSISIMYADENCPEFNSSHIESGVMTFNGTYVKMSTQCVGKWLAAKYPTTKKGARYVWDQFVKSNYVYTKLGDVNVRFSAKGFTDAAKKHKEIQAAL